MHEIYLISYLITNLKKPKFNYILFKQEPELTNVLRNIAYKESKFTKKDIQPHDIIILGVSKILDNNNYEFENEDNENYSEQCIKSENQNYIDSITIEKSKNK